MATPPNLLPLKVLVISLGFVLIGGTVFLFGAIASKAGKELGNAPAAARCRDAQVNLQGKGAVTGVSAQGDTVQITLAAPPSTKVLTVDRCSGTILQTLLIEP